MDSLAIIIPARLGATRFPKKMLYPVLGKPLILWTVEAATETKLAERVIVATDHEDILRVVQEAGFDAEMTRPDHPSGTDRVWEIAQRLDCEWVMNLQGDEPLMKADVLDSLAKVALDSIDTINPQSEKHAVEMATLVRDLDPVEARDPNRVKVVTDLWGNALYFSRSPIPYTRIVNEAEPEGQTLPKYLLHVGVYLYRRDILQRLVSMERTYLEKTEGLEQLRALENGISIRCVKTSHDFMGVDAQSDVPKVETALRSRFGEKSGKVIDVS